MGVLLNVVSGARRWGALGCGNVRESLSLAVLPENYFRLRMARRKTDFRAFRLLLVLSVSARVGKVGSGVRIWLKIQLPFICGAGWADQASRTRRCVGRLIFAGGAMGPELTI